MNRNRSEFTANHYMQQITIKQNKALPSQADNSGFKIVLTCFLFLSIGAILAF